MEIKTWADFGALSKEELDALSPEELEEIKASIRKAEEEARAASEAEAKKKEEEYAKAKELAENYKIRAEKAEKALKGKREDGGDTPKNELSQSDLITLIRADVPEEDFEEVISYAQFKKISVKEALKSSVVRTILSERKEERETAQATSTGNKRKGTHTPSGKELLANARKSGELPESDEDIRKLAAAQFEK